MAFEQELLKRHHLSVLADYRMEKTAASSLTSSIGYETAQREKV